MSKEKRYLITTADERTWKFDRPVVFLGEWCRLHDRKHVWESMDAVVAPPYGLGQAQKDADYLKVKKYEALLFPIIVELLNQYHSVVYTERFWKILIGHWVRRYFQVIVNRVSTIEQCLEIYTVTGMTGDSTSFTLATTDSVSAVWAFNDDSWNNALSSAIFEIKKDPDIFFEEKKSKSNRFELLLSSNKRSRCIDRFVRSSFAWLDFLRKDTDSVICSSYLPKLTELKLNLALLQIPRFTGFQHPIINRDVNKVHRVKLSDSLVTKAINNNSNVIDICVATFLFELIPICYLEGFFTLKNQVSKIKAPSNPKFILTSNNFDTDESFKLWAALKTEAGVPYYVGQHGNNYGTSRYMNPSVEEETSDKFLTWGWVDLLEQHTPAFMFKLAEKRKSKYSRDGGLLLVEICVGHRIETWDITNEYANYFESQKKLINCLRCGIKEEVTIRLQAAARNFKWSDELRWRAFDTSLKIDVGVTKMSELIKKNRLVVYSYDSTGILESFASNIPTLAFWDNGYDHLRDNAKPYYKLLVEAGIVHLSPESLADKINEIWDNVEQWWFSNEVQFAKNKFCERYAVLEKTPVRTLKKILLN